ncbi:uncharacterized protein N7506_005447 [Penicillium brevicompactum]|uniref:uncharacterized protein n=1 Tax=Penicillium brevicompactum TaxID=5074 RepID=UPI0025411EAF|nr:uncharacterized protein N7506_005447 [Penicillium brevicompactum]KAJ5337425.1 hypothetical protein N7506_005447 [Penicillium brevicompactum]
MSNTKEDLDPVSGHKTGPDNPNVPDEVKGHAHAVLDQGVGNDRSHKQRDLTSVTAGPKAAQHNSGGMHLGKTKAYEDLIRKGGETPED